MTNEELKRLNSLIGLKIVSIEVQDNEFIFKLSGGVTFNVSAMPCGWENSKPVIEFDDGFEIYADD